MHICGRMKIEWLGHASFRIETVGKVIYIDPFAIKDNGRDADLVLISHEHYDHCDINSIEKIRKHHTSILTSEDAAGKIFGKFRNVGILRPGDITEFDEIKIIAVHSYNIE
ncbi:MAG TPA: MBL fold metallo-hydrolase, partial [Candidatus Altiarchaeales archaeon]|nr:MBL fold metallo-hydrolase [Candidatus Altiarchaeales archaeon]